MSTQRRMVVCAVAVSHHAPYIRKYDLTDLPQGANYDLFLFDDRVLKGAQFIEQSRNIGNAAERIVHTSAKAMRYYIRVVMYTRSTNAPNTYILAASSS